MAGMSVGLAGALAFVVLAPPLWLLRLAWVHVVEPRGSLGDRSGDWFFKWAGQRQVVLAMELLQDADPQMRYCGAMMAWSDVKNGAYTAAQLAVLRSRIHDEVPEVGWAAWSELCEREDEVAFLVRELQRCNEPGDIGLRLDCLGSGRRSRPDVVEGALKLATDPRPAIRAAVLPSLARWSPSVPAMADAVRAATHDADATVREQAVMAQGEPRDAAGLTRLLDMWNDPAACVRVSAFRVLSQHIGRSTSKRNPSATAPHWTEDAVQNSLVPYARNPAVTVDERVSAARWIADPATLRASCRELLAAVEHLPERVVHDGTRHLTRRDALALLATRWVLADEYAQLSVKYPRENSYGLDKHPELVGLLNRCIAEDRSAESTLETLRGALKQSGIMEESGNRQTAVELMINLSRASKTPSGGGTGG